MDETITPEQKQYANRVHEQWVAQESTQRLLEKLQAWAKLPVPVFYRPEEVVTYQANAVVKGAYQEIIDLIHTPPHPVIYTEPEGDD